MHWSLRVVLVAILALYARKTNKLTLKGTWVAVGVALVHCIPPTSLFLSMLATFFLLGTFATKIKADAKRRIVNNLDDFHNDTERTDSNSDEVKAKRGRTASQVLSNAGVPTVLILVADLFHTFWGHHGQLAIRRAIIAHYAAMTADTLSSELGILWPSSPILLIHPFSGPVPKGTNGGVSIGGVAAGVLGACIIGYVTSWYWVSPWIAVVWGILGTLLDSAIGATYQESIADTDGKIYESSDTKIGEYGKHIAGHNVLTNSQVNVATSVIVSILAFIL